MSQPDPFPWVRPSILRVSLPERRALAALLWAALASVGHWMGAPLDALIGFTVIYYVTAMGVIHTMMTVWQILSMFLICVTGIFGMVLFRG